MQVIQHTSSGNQTEIKRILKQIHQNYLDKSLVHQIHVLIVPDSCLNCCVNLVNKIDKVIIKHIVIFSHTNYRELMSMDNNG